MIFKRPAIFLISRNRASVASTSTVRPQRNLDVEVKGQQGSLF